MSKFARKAAAMIVLLAVLASTAGCSTEQGANRKDRDTVESRDRKDDNDGNKKDKDDTGKKTGNLMQGITARAVDISTEASAYGPALTDFALRLFKAGKANRKSDENVLISPLSVLLALSMTANGADGETLVQMEKVLGMSKDELNEFAYTYTKMLAERDPEAGRLELANSIWFREDPAFSVEKAFLQINSDYYGADIYASAFDGATLNAINSWVNEKTEEMIPKILEEISKDAVMYLINALAFDAEWDKAYEEFAVYDDEFTAADGKKITLPYLHGEENTYLEDENAAGFIKYYKGFDYAFAAILPNEGVDIDAYLATLDGAHLNRMLENRSNCRVLTSMPKFETDYSVSMGGLLGDMGMERAFDPYNAEFSKLGIWKDENIYISDVVHKTFIKVDEKGTKAGAATAVIMAKTTSVGPDLTIPKEVYLTRPFIYMLIDCNTNSPFFIGVMDRPSGK